MRLAASKLRARIRNSRRACRMDGKQIGDGSQAKLQRLSLRFGPSSWDPRFTSMLSAGNSEGGCILRLFV